MTGKKELEIAMLLQTGSHFVPFIADVAREAREASRVQIEISVPGKQNWKLV